MKAGKWINFSFPICLASVVSFIKAVVVLTWAGAIINPFVFCYKS